MTDEQIADVWLLFKEFLDKKHIELSAERYIDLLADYGVSDETLEDLMGTDSTLDYAIQYYLDDTSDEDEDDDPWDDE